jgi:hypothetical protein
MPALRAPTGKLSLAAFKIAPLSNKNTTRLILIPYFEWINVVKY